ncbi:dihydrofolate reductase family protein [Neoaquamicrobium sediminum]|uniref:Dihydrofolate reductase family protein n=1 Tax=Neoaquamicrobium sediminum TaxID=1849104 RepID=A0ABV3WPK2_9HYPH
MGRIIATQYMSLDGVIQDPVGMEGSGLGDWTGPFSRGPTGDAFKHRELADANAMIYGRVTYDGFAAVWPLVNDPEGYAARINSLPKYVASRTLETVDWSNSSLIEGDLVDAARKIRASVDGDVLIFGSASIVHQLLPHGLVDELRLMVFPTILGRGTRLFPDGVAATLELAGNEQFDDGIVLLRYTTVQP